MYNFDKESRELQSMYNFGNRNDDNVAQGQGSQVPIIPTQLEDLNMHSDDEKKDSENVQGFHGSVSHVYSLPEPSAFGSEKLPVVANNIYSSNEIRESDTVFKKKVEKTKDTGKLRIAKEILGLNKKNVKGLSASEKERVLLEERWKKAMIEESRLDSVEERLRGREQATAAAGLRPNFPPKFLCIKPLVHHDIATVPELRRRFVRLNFMNWLATSILLLLNVLVVIGIMCAPYREGVNKKFNISQNIALSIFYLVGGPLSFIVWYWHVYVACSTGRHTRHILSLSGLFVALGFSIFMIVGKTNVGACGIGFAIDTAEFKSKLVIFPIIIVMALWFAEAAFLVFCIIKQWTYYRLDVNAQQEVRRQMRNVIGI